MIDLDQWVAERLVCPRDRRPVRARAGTLACPDGHRYPVVEGIPVMLLEEVKQTHAKAVEALRQSTSAGEESWQFRVEAPSEGVDPFVQAVIGATNGYMYKPLIGRLEQYPIPTLPGACGPGTPFLDVGCNWGRWCIAAGRAGYQPVGIDPSLDAIRAARRVARQLGVRVSYLVGDARHLPFSDEAMDVIFSYSVLQHLEQEDVRFALRGMRRVLRVGGSATVQMANAFGLRSLYHQLRRGFRRAAGFEVRYWVLPALLSIFESLIGPAKVSVDGFFSLNVQPSDACLLLRRYRLVVRASEALRRVSEKIPAMAYAADSVYITARRDSAHARPAVSGRSCAAERSSA